MAQLRRFLKGEKAPDKTEKDGPEVVGTVEFVDHNTNYWTLASYPQWERERNGQ